MKVFIFIAVLFIAAGVQSVRGEEQSDRPHKTTTLSELSKMSGAKVTVYKYPQPEDDHSDIPVCPSQILSIPTMQ